MKKIDRHKPLIAFCAKSVNIYQKELGKFPVLRQDEEISLVRRMKLGDADARTSLINSNLKFVFLIAKQYASKYILIEDLISEGNIGLIKSLDKFDETKGFKLISHAVWWIRQMMLRYIQEQIRMIRLPNNQINGIAKIEKCMDALMVELGRNASAEEIAQRSGIPPDKIIEYRLNSAQVWRLDLPSEESGACLLDVVADASALPADHLVMPDDLEELVKNLGILPVRSQHIVKHLYGIDGYQQTSLENTSKQVNLSKERSRQLKYEAIRTMKGLYNVPKRTKRGMKK